MRNTCLVLALTLGAILLPWVIGNPYFTHILIMSGLSIVLALGLNCAIGLAGQMSFAQAAFYGIGAYSSALLTMKLGLSFWVALPLSALIAALFGLLLGLITIRLGSFYLVIATLGFQKIVELVISHWNSLTRGAMGISGIPSPNPIKIPGIFNIVFEDINVFYYFVLILVGLMIGVTVRIRNSRLGLELFAVRDDQGAARSVGVKATKVKVIAFSISALAAGVAGCFFAHYVHNIHPESFTVGMSFYIILMVIIGGIGTIAGPIFGAIFLTVLPEYLRFFQDYKMIIYGLTLMVFIIFFPRGLFGMYRFFSKYWIKKVSVVSDERKLDIA